MGSHKQLDKLEGIQLLRGVAIFFVVAYHVFYIQVFSNSNLVAYSPLGFGFLGVQLFFVISGFVIVKSLVQVVNLHLFVIKRYLRLLPPLLLILPVLIFTSTVIPQSPFRDDAKFSNLFPSLSLISPDFLNLFTHHVYANVSGVMWSLNAEISFYLLSGAIYFFLKRNLKKFFIAAVAISTIVSIIHLISFSLTQNHLVAKLDSIILITRIQNFPWFCIGIWFFVFKDYGTKLVPKSNHLILLLLFIEGVSSRFNILAPSQTQMLEVAYSLLILILFRKFGKIHTLQYNFFSKILIGLGNFSYELYLLHFGMIIPIYALMESQGVLTSVFFRLLLSTFLIIITAGLSKLIYEYGSRPLTQIFKRLLNLYKVSI